MAPQLWRAKRFRDIRNVPIVGAIGMLPNLPDPISIGIGDTIASFAPIALALWGIAIAPNVGRFSMSYTIAGAIWFAPIVPMRVTMRNAMIVTSGSSATSLPIVTETRSVRNVLAMLDSPNVRVATGGLTI
jgi:hypothetical protein